MLTYYPTYQEEPSHVPVDIKKMFGIKLEVA
jgi:hypothetical protein